MRLDRTRIAIRERSLLGILDMSLRVLATFILPILLCSAAIVIPLMLFNGWLVNWMATSGDIEASYLRYFTVRTLLIIIEAPLISLGITPVLGRVMFMEPFTAKRILSTIASSFFSLLITLFVIRGIGIAWFQICMVSRSDTIFSNWEGWLIPLVLLSLLIRALRPFIMEIILLERSPLRSQDSQMLTLRRRSASLHGPNSGDLFGRNLSNAFTACILAASILGSIWFAWGMLLFNWSWGPIMLYVCYPLSLWIVAMYFAVVRFLCYLDLRIRREGWEVELMMRAASARMEESIT